MRINKYLAWKKYSTRRGADELIEAGRVFINGREAVLGDKVNEDDDVHVKGGVDTSSLVYFAYNKPIGIVTHSAEENQEDIGGVFPIRGVFPVGRLDKDSHGLIILTNDGRVTDRLLNPEYTHDKEYVVRTSTKLPSNFKRRMETGVNIEGYVTKPCTVSVIGSYSFKIILTEGKKHQIRRMCSALRVELADLKRIRILNINLGGLKEGSYRKIEGKELETFKKKIGL